MVHLRLCLDDLTMLFFKAKRFVCKWQNYQKFWEKWMQISLLDFDSKGGEKRTYFQSRTSYYAPFFLIRESSEAFLFMLNLFLWITEFNWIKVTVDTVTLKYALFLKIWIFQLCIELQQQQQWRRISWTHSHSDGFLPLALFSPLRWFGHMKHLVLGKVKHFFCCQVLPS